MSESVGFDGIERDRVRPLLKGFGFRKRGLVFSRVRGGLTDVISLQRSSGNAGGRVRLYVNCGVYSAEFASAIGETVSERPREVDCQFRCRLDTLVPVAPQWYEIEDGTDAESIGTALADALESAVFALSAVTTADEIAGRISHGVATEAFRYRIATREWESAREIYSSIRAEFGAEDRWPRIDAILRKYVPAAQLALVIGADQPM